MKLLTWNKKEENKDSHSSYDSSWDNERQAPVVIDKGPGYERTKNIPNRCVRIPNSHNESTAETWQRLYQDQTTTAEDDKHQLSGQSHNPSYNPLKTIQ